jgi:hypothetical protein
MNVPHDTTSCFIEHFEISNVRRRIDPSSPISQSFALLKTQRIRMKSGLSGDDQPVVVVAIWECNM